MLGSKVVNFPHGRGVEGSNIRAKFNTIGSTKHMTQTPLFIGILTKDLYLRIASLRYSKKGYYSRQYIHVRLKLPPSLNKKICRRLKNLIDYYYS